tara:strand:+ start:14 stop:475 length:462 start_codon:yes stop_codon:yes gene_type:complete
MSKDKNENYEENVDVLITHGEEALTFRKDDPTTQEYLNKKAQVNLDMMKEYGKVDLWYGISLSNARQEGEIYDNYKQRLKTVKNLEKIYKSLGKEECHKQFPYGFAYALYNQVGDGINKNDSEQPQMTATIENEDGTIEKANVIINNNTNTKE